MKKPQQTKALLAQAFEKFLKVVDEQKGPLFVQANKKLLEETFYSAASVTFSLMQAFAKMPAEIGKMQFGILKDELDEFGGKYDERHHKKLDS